MQKWKIPVQIGVAVLLVAMTIAVLVTTDPGSTAGKGALSGIGLGFAGLLYGLYYDRKQAARRREE